MTQKRLARIVRFFLHWHYDIRLTRSEVLYKSSPVLILPNHTAYIDPIILFSELYDLPVSPMVDERFMRNPWMSRILSIAKAVEVPDLAHSAMTREEGAAQAGRLTEIAREALANGRSMVIYPSGHIKTVDKEIIGNRRLAYELCQALPAHTRVILCHMRGLESSRWSKLKPKKWLWRREVVLDFEDRTEELQRKAQTMSRREFNEHLENWYNSH